MDSSLGDFLDYTIQYFPLFFQGSVLNRLTVDPKYFSGSAQVKTTDTLETYDLVLTDKTGIEDQNRRFIINCPKRRGEC